MKPISVSLEAKPKADAELRRFRFYDDAMISEFKRKTLDGKVSKSNADDDVLVTADNQAMRGTTHP